jgi:hypothetical protein
MVAFVHGWLTAALQELFFLHFFTMLHGALMVRLLHVFLLFRI